MRGAPWGKTMEWHLPRGVLSQQVRRQVALEHSAPVAVSASAAACVLYGRLCGARGLVPGCLAPQAEELRVAPFLPAIPLHNTPV